MRRVAEERKEVEKTATESHFPNPESEKNKNARQREKTNKTFRSLTLQPSSGPGACDTHVSSQADEPLHTALKTLSP